MGANNSFAVLASRGGPRHTSYGRRAAEMASIRWAARTSQVLIAAISPGVKPSSIAASSCRTAGVAASSRRWPSPVRLACRMRPWVGWGWAGVRRHGRAHGHRLHRDRDGHARSAEGSHGLGEPARYRQGIGHLQHHALVRRRVRRRDPRRGLCRHRQLRLTPLVHPGIQLGDRGFRGDRPDRRGGWAGPSG
jgi:hypothetical protein